MQILSLCMLSIAVSKIISSYSVVLWPFFFWNAFFFLVMLFCAQYTPKKTQCRILVRTFQICWKTWAVASQLNMVRIDQNMCLCFVISHLLWILRWNVLLQFFCLKYLNQDLFRLSVVWREKIVNLSFFRAGGKLLLFYINVAMFCVCSFGFLIHCFWLFSLE